MLKKMMLSIASVLMLCTMMFAGAPAASAADKVQSYGAYGTQSECQNAQWNKINQVKPIAKDYWFSGCEWHGVYAGHLINVWVYEYWYIKK